jgi:hypothetical protein
MSSISPIDLRPPCCSSLGFFTINVSGFVQYLEEKMNEQEWRGIKDKVVELTLADETETLTLDDCDQFKKGAVERGLPIECFEDGGLLIEHQSVPQKLETDGLICTESLLGENRYSELSGGEEETEEEYRKFLRCWLEECFRDPDVSTVVGYTLTSVVHTDGRCCTWLATFAGSQPADSDAIHIGFFETKNDALEHLRQNGFIDLDSESEMSVRSFADYHVKNWRSYDRIGGA